MCTPDYFDFENFTLDLNVDIAYLGKGAPTSSRNSSSIPPLIINYFVLLLIVCTQEKKTLASPLPTSICTFLLVSVSSV